MKGFPSTIYLPSPSRTVTRASPGALCGSNASPFQNDIIVITKLDFATKFLLTICPSLYSTQSARLKALAASNIFKVWFSIASSPIFSPISISFKVSDDFIE